MTNQPPPYPGDPGPEDQPPASGSDDATTSGLPSYGSVTPPEGSVPPPPPPSPGAPGTPAEPFSATAAISWGWGMFKKNAGQTILAVVLIFVVSAVLGGLTTAVGPSGGGIFDPTGMNLDLDAGGLVWNFILTVIVAAVTYIITVAISRGTLDVADGGTFDIGAAFGKIDVGQAVIAGLIVGALTQIGFMLLVLPGIIVAFFTYFTSYYVAEGVKPVEAVQQSFSLVGANLGNAVVLAILSFLVIVLGLIALCVGVLAAIPVTFLASGYAFRRFQGQPVQPVPAD